jgi:hypothetical protein
MSEADGALVRRRGRGKIEWLADLHRASGIGRKISVAVMVRDEHVPAAVAGYFSYSPIESLSTVENRVTLEAD